MVILVGAVAGRLAGMAFWGQWGTYVKKRVIYNVEPRYL
jgi:hypothetical protein